MASGRVPAVVLDATGAVASGPVVVLGEAGEPMLRFTASSTKANLNSPTWALTVPLEVGGRRLDLRGASTWVPDPALAAGDAERGAVPVVVGLAVIVATAAAVCAVLLLRRRRARPSGGRSRHG